MTRRITVPLIADILLVDDAALMKKLNEHEYISRFLLEKGPFVHRMIRSKIYGTLHVNGTPLPVFTGEDFPGRQTRQQELKASYSKVDLNGETLKGDLEKLADYVGGKQIKPALGVVVQQLIGRLFLPSYTATEQSYEDAKRINKWPRADPFSSQIQRWTGSLEKARQRLWSKAENDTHLIHATAIAMHNIVETLENMRKLADGGGASDGASAVAQCLVGPASLLRSCTRKLTLPELKKPLKEGTLVIFQLEKIHKGSDNNGLAFLLGAWSECPALEIVPRILEQAWERGTGMG